MTTKPADAVTADEARARLFDARNGVPEAANIGADTVLRFIDQAESAMIALRSEAVAACALTIQHEGVIERLRAELAAEKLAHAETAEQLDCYRAIDFRSREL